MNLDSVVERLQEYEVWGDYNKEHADTILGWSSKSAAESWFLRRKWLAPDFSVEHIMVAPKQTRDAAVKSYPLWIINQA